jgi:predicted RNA-binding protein
VIGHWLLSTTADNWELIVKHGVYAFRRKTDRDKVRPGDRVLFYLARSRPQVIVGTYEITGSWTESKSPFWPMEKTQKRIVWPWRFPLSMVRLGAVNVRELLNELSFIVRKDTWSVYFVGSLANFGRPIPKSDYERIYSMLAKKPVSYQVLPPPER